MDTLERYKELARQYDALHKLRQEDDDLEGEMEFLWWKLTEAEKEEVRKLSCELHEAWSPQERYDEALIVIANIQSMIPPGPNDRTPLESRLECLRHWEGRRDKALSEGAKP